MYRIINSNMAQGVREISVERGYDPREFLFIVAGGAGSIHSSEICKELEIPMFLVPNVSSIFCAAGMLLGDLKHDYIRSYFTSFKNLERKKFISLFNEMKEEGINALVVEEGVARERISFSPILDMRYLGQYHEVQMESSWDDVLNFNLESIFESFHKEHNRQFGYSLKEEGTEMELINVRLRVVGKTERPKFLSENFKSISAESAIKEHREVYIPELNRMKKVPVYDGDKPIFGSKIKGPCVIEKITTSVFVSENYDCLVDEFGSFIVYEKEKYPKGFKMKEKQIRVVG
jgi:N-methylhydantoinase A